MVEQLRYQMLSSFVPTTGREHMNIMALGSQKRAVAHGSRTSEDSEGCCSSSDGSTCNRSAAQWPSGGWPGAAVEIPAEKVGCGSSPRQ